MPISLEAVHFAPNRSRRRSFVRRLLKTLEDFKSILDDNFPIVIIIGVILLVLGIIFACNRSEAAQQRANYHQAHAWAKRNHGRVLRCNKQGDHGFYVCVIRVDPGIDMRVVYDGMEQPLMVAPYWHTY